MIYDKIEFLVGTYSADQTAIIFHREQRLTRDSLQEALWQGGI